jgi:hypothetical protein
MGFLAPSAPALPAIPAAPPPFVPGAQPTGQKPTGKVTQSTVIPGAAFPGSGQTQTASLLGSTSATGGRSTLLGG